MADAVRTAAEDEDLLALAGICLAACTIVELVLVRGVEVRSESLEFRRAGINPLENGMDRTLLAVLPHYCQSHARQLGQPRVREASALEVGERIPITGQAVHTYAFLYRHEVGDLAQEPAIHVRSPVDGVHGESCGLTLAS